MKYTIYLSFYLIKKEPKKCNSSMTMNTNALSKLPDILYGTFKTEISLIMEVITSICRIKVALITFTKKFVSK